MHIQWSSRIPDTRFSWSAFLSLQWTTFQAWWLRHIPSWVRDSSM